MGQKLPVVINDVRFWINPTNMVVRKALNIAQLDTMRGRQFQVWWPSPEVVSISGEAFGKDAYKQLLYLKRHYEGTGGNPSLSTLTYKTYKYDGYIVNLDVTADAKNMNVWIYSLNFQLLHGNKFRVEDFSLTESNPVLHPLTQVDKIGELLNLAIDDIFD